MCIRDRYRICYQPNVRGCHHLHINVDGEYLKESPFAINVKQPIEKLGGLVRTIPRVDMPTVGVIVKQNGEVIVAEEGGAHCVSIFSQMGDRYRSIGQGQLKLPRGIALNSDGNVIVVDAGKNCVSMFTCDGKFSGAQYGDCLLYTSPSPRDATLSRMPSSA